MDRLKARILRFLPEEKKFLHEIYEQFIDDHANLWREAENLDLARLRYILFVIVKLFYEEHKHLNDISQIDQQEFNRAVRELISNRDAFLQKAQKAQIKAIDRLGVERWFNAFKKDIEKINEVIEKYEKKVLETHKINNLFKKGQTTRASLGESRTLEQVAERLAHFIIAVPLEVSIEVSGLSTADLNARFQSLKKVINEDNARLNAAFQDLRKGFGQTEPDFANLSQAVDFFERKALYDSNVNTAIALQAEYQKRLLEQHKFLDVYKLRQTLASKRSERQRLEGRIFAGKQRQKLDNEIRSLEAASREYDAGIAYISFDSTELQGIALNYAARLLKYYDVLSSQYRQTGILNQQLLDYLVQDYTQHFVLREAYRTSRGHQVFLAFPPDEQTRVINRAKEEFKRLAYFVAGNKNKQIINDLSESQKRVAQVLFNAVIEREKRKESGVDYNHSSREQLKRDIQDILRRESYEDSLERFVSSGITPEVWQIFSSRKEMVDMYGIEALEGFKREAGAMIWGRILTNPRGSGSVSAFALTPISKVPYLVMNFWTQRDSHGESWAMREIGDVLSSFSEKEVKRMERLNVPGLMDVVRTLRTSPNALGATGMTGTEENKIIDEGLVKICVHYLNNGTPEEKYFGLKTATNLNCVLLTGRDHIADPKLVRQRELLIPAIANIVKIPEASLREPKAIREIIPEIGFYFKFEDLKAGKGYNRKL